MYHSKPSYRNPKSKGFTLIELLVVLAIIGVLVGLLLPTLQGGRETVNKDRALKDVSQIVSAENKRFTPNLAALAKLGLIDPTLGTGSKDGYHFAVARSVTGAFLVTATPAAPGVTGSSDITADPTGAVTSKPSGGADAARAAMFAAIDAEAATAIGQELWQAPSELLPAVQRFFQQGAAQNPYVLHTVFKRLDADGNGKVTFREILSYDKNPDSPLGAFLVALDRHLQLGLANEDVVSLPGVGLSDLLPAVQDHDDGQFHFNVVRGSSTIVAGASETAVELRGFCDGSVAPNDQTRVSLDRAQFGALLPAVSAHLLSGTFLISGDNKVAVRGILVGLLQQEVGSGRQTLNGFFLVTGGSGPLEGAFGSGRASLDWQNMQSNLFDADLEGTLLFALPVGH